MSIEAFPTGYVTVDEYLAGEASSGIKHEYLGGVVYAMSGAAERMSSLRAISLGCSTFVCVVNAANPSARICRRYFIPSLAGAPTIIILTP